MYYCCDVVLWLAMRLCDSIDMTYHCCNIVLWLAIRLCVAIDDVTSYTIVVILRCGWQGGSATQLMMLHHEPLLRYCAVVGMAAVRLN